MRQAIAAALTAMLCVACEGPPGAQGPQGEQGEQGLPGMDATAGAGGGWDYQPTLHWGCLATLDLLAAGGIDLLGSDGVNETELVYSGTLYSNDDVFVSCEGHVGGAESAAGSSYYPSVTMGAGAALCTFTLNYPPYTDPLAGIWEYTLDDRGPRVTYLDDSAHPLDAMSYVFEATDCAIRRTNDDGEWEDVAFDDVFAN